MKFGTWGIGVPLIGVAGVGAALVIAACSSTKTSNPATDAGGGVVTAPEAGAACGVPAAASFAEANCNTCTPVAKGCSCPSTVDPGCPINAAKCGDPTTCLPLANNTGKTVADFRMRRLNVAAPAALATTFVQSAVVTKNIDLNAKECGETGAAAFNWLLRVDMAKNLLTTGGAPPTTDPFNLGFCFYNHHAPPSKAINVAPITAALTKNADGTYTTAAAPLLNVPIFLNGQINNVIILPISQATMHSLSISADQNCIGAFNQTALDSQCSDDPTTCQKWITAGSMGGFITLEAADSVQIAELNESLCVLLTTSTPDATTRKCQRDGAGKIKYSGDYCSTTQAPGGCADSYWMAATFAASAVHIDDTGATPECVADSAGPADAGAE